MEVKVTLREIVIKDRQSGKEYIVRTLRTGQEIVSYVEESEKDEIALKLEQALSEAYHQ